MLYDDLKSELTEKRKLKDKINIKYLSTLIGEIQRMRDKDYDNDEIIIKLIKSLYKKATKSPLPDKDWMKFLDKYIPTDFQKFIN